MNQESLGNPEGRSPFRSTILPIAGNIAKHPFRLARMLMENKAQTGDLMLKNTLLGIPIADIALSEADIRNREAKQAVFSMVHEILILDGLIENSHLTSLADAMDRARTMPFLADSLDFYHDIVVAMSVEERVKRGEDPYEIIDSIQHNDPESPINSMVSTKIVSNAFSIVPLILAQNLGEDEYWEEIQPLADDVNASFRWATDLFGFVSDLSEGEAHDNIIVYHQQENDCTMEEAVLQAIEQVRVIRDTISTERHHSHRTTRFLLSYFNFADQALRALTSYDDVLAAARQYDLHY